ncbi:MAG: FHA domain-containing protein [Clostridium sp.]
MGFSKLMIGVFGIIFIVILYLIIYYSLKIMYKDVKGGGKKKSPTGLKRNFGIEVIETTDGSGIKEGSVFPIRDSITIGRRDDNSIVIQDGHISSNHLKIIIKNNIAYLEDLNSTNGTFVNGERVTGRVKLFPKDEIRVGNSVFKVLI